MKNCYCIIIIVVSCRLMQLILIYRVLLQKARFSSQVICFIGIIMTITGYLLMTDWQAIPYDPCTEYSPFHHPNRFQKQTEPLHTEYFNKTSKKFSSSQNMITQPSPFHFTAMDMYSDLELNLDDGEIIDTRLPIRLLYSCHLNNNCSICEEDITKPCLSFTVDTNGHTSLSGRKDGVPQLFSCSLNSLVNFCVTIYQDHTSSTEEMEDLLADAEIQRLMVLSDDVYTIASNACMNASSGQCHWIPFSTLTGKKCLDCPPICRGKQQTLLFPLFLIGIAILTMCFPLVWVPTLAMANNQSPKSIQVSLICTDTILKGDV